MQNTENRKYTIVLFFVLIALVFAVRLFYMQILDDKWVNRASEISENKISTYPARGIGF